MFLWCLINILSYRETQINLPFYNNIKASKQQQQNPNQNETKQGNKQKPKAADEKKCTKLKNQKEKVKYPEACLEGVPDTQPITTSYGVDLLKRLLSAP